MNAYDKGLERNPANYTPLTPVSFLAKAACVYPERTAVIHGAVRRTWRETYARCRRLASALVKHGVALSITIGVKDSKFHRATSSKDSHACWVGWQDFAARPS